MLKPFTQGMKVLETVIAPDKDRVLDNEFRGTFYASRSENDSHMIHIPSLMKLHEKIYSLSSAGVLIDELRDRYRLQFSASGVVIDIKYGKQVLKETEDPLWLRFMDDIKSAQLTGEAFDINFTEADTAFILKKYISSRELQKLDLIFGDMIASRDAPDAKTLVKQWRAPVLRNMGGRENISIETLERMLKTPYPRKP
ncbi:MAG TPA: hypothetical protein VKE88_01575 [Candidatus Nanoarchaeia archaeon]|nr:hypothetical protein [Candidatus Nanoarchaeia archaeon]